MAKVVLHAADLLDAARKIEDAAQRIDGALQKIDTIVGEIEPVWSDENTKKYLARYNELKQEFPGFKEAVHNYGTFLNEVVKTYQREFIDSVSQSVQ